MRTVRGRVGGEALRERLRASGVRPVQHEQRLQIRRVHPRRGVRPLYRRIVRAPRHERRRGDREQAGPVLARDGVYVEIVGLDGERLLDLELVRGVVHDEVEALQDGHERELCLLPCELVALG